MAIKSLWKHQQDTVTSAPDRFALFWEVGTGKTATLIGLAARAWVKHKKVLKTLVVCPKQMRAAWVREFEAFSFLSRGKVHIIGGAPARRKRLLADRHMNIHVMNYESVAASLRAKKKVMRYGKVEMVKCLDVTKLPVYDVLIIDESHLCKSHKADRTKAVLAIGCSAKYIYLATGTPVTNSLGDLFSQMQILDDKVLGRNFFAFRNKYFVDKNERWKGGKKYYPDYVVREGAKSELWRKLTPYCSNIKKEQCLDLPPKVYQTADCEMSPAQRKAYREMAKEYITYVESGAATASVALTKLIRLQQITTGFVTLEDGTPYDFPRVPRMDAIREDIETLAPHHKIIIWSNFTRNLEVIYEFCDFAGFNPSRYYGNHCKQSGIDTFRNKNESRVFIANPKGAGSGITLTCSNVSLFYSNSFSLSERVQAEGRNHRAGSEVHSKVTYRDYVTPDSVDQLVQAAIHRKKELLNDSLAINPLKITRADLGI